MNTCAECIHAEMCRWIDEVERDGCDFFDGDPWIPVSERLPEEYKKVIVSDAYNGIYIGEFIDAAENWGGKHFINEHGMHSKSVTAWMPLPKPYKEESEEEK